jgi:hypothetical protein
VSLLPPESKPDHKPVSSAEDPPPALGSWRRIYFGVIGWLLFLIVAFYWFTRRFAP